MDFVAGKLTLPQPKGYASNTTVVDWILVRKYNSPEPAFSSAGAEQTPDLVSVYIRHNPALTGGMV